MKFICDRMLGKLSRWLRIAGYDTLYVADLGFDIKYEDDYMANDYTDRILLTKDKGLYNKAKSTNRNAYLVMSSEVGEQLKELEGLGVKFRPVMERCSVCNRFLRIPKKEEINLVLKGQGIENDLSELYELWYCKNCQKLYWKGSHWRNMIKFLEKYSIDYK